MQEEKLTNDEVFMTSSTRLATALLALGHSLRKPPCTRQVRRDGNQIVTFLFQPVTEGAFETCGKVAARWSQLQEEDMGGDNEDDLRDRLVWLRKISQSEDPIAIAYANAAWRDICLSIVKATPRMVQVEAGGAIAYIREDATVQDMRRFQSQI